MKSRYSLCILFVMLVVSSHVASAQTSVAEPSYEVTVQYIQERMATGFQEDSRCHFTDRRGRLFQEFNVADLSRRIDWGGVERSGSIDCANGAGCINFGAPSGRLNRSWIFTLKDNNDAPKMQRALLHLLDLCGVRPPAPDVF